jgi:hypothetical protein
MATITGKVLDVVIRVLSVFIRNWTLLTVAVYFLGFDGGLAWTLSIGSYLLLGKLEHDDGMNPRIRLDRWSRLFNLATCVTFLVFVSRRCGHAMRI